MHLAALFVVFCCKRLGFLLGISDWQKAVDMRQSCQPFSEDVARSIGSD